MIQNPFSKILRKDVEGLPGGNDTYKCHHDRRTRKPFITASIDTYW